MCVVPSLPHPLEISAREEKLALQSSVSVKLITLKNRKRQEHNFEVSSSNSEVGDRPAASMHFMAGAAKEAAGQAGQSKSRNSCRWVSSLAYV